MNNTTDTLRAVDLPRSCSPLCDVHRRLDEAMKELEWERNTRKNLQHVIVSKWGAGSIGQCIDVIRQTEKDIGPLGPINDWSLAQILSAHLQQPAELIINDLRQQVEDLKANIQAHSQKGRERGPANTQD